MPLDITHSLRSKIFLRFTLIVGLALIAAGSCSVLIAERAIERHTYSALVSAADDSANTLTHLLEERRAITRMLALESKNSPPVTLRLHLQEAKTILPGLSDALILDTKGKVVAATDTRREGENLSALPLFTLGSQGTYLGPLNLAEGKSSHALASPIRKSSGELSGVLIAEFRMEDVFRIFANESVLGGAAEYLLIEPRRSGSACINPKDVVLSLQGALPTPWLQDNAEQRNTLQKFFRTGSGILPLASAGIPICERAAIGEEGILSGTDEGGETVIAAHRLLFEVGVGTLVSIRRDEAFRPILLLISVLIGTTGILLLLVTLVSLRLSRDVVTPILSLQKSLRGLDTGHWKHKRSVFTGDELETLDKETSRLAVRLEEAYSSLEKNVQERTRELAEDRAKDEALLESIGDGVLATDLSGKIVACNRAAELMLKWGREELLKGHFSSCLVLRSREKKLMAPHEHFVQMALDQRATMRSTPIAPTTASARM